MKRLKYTPGAMKIKPLKDETNKYLRKYQIVKKFQKAGELFEQDVNHPSLNVEILEPKHLKVYSFRLDKNTEQFLSLRLMKSK